MIHFTVFLGIIIPFLATAIGAAAVFFLGKHNFHSYQKIFCAFAAGVMVAASVWSLLIPALEKSQSPFPATFGVLLGVTLFSFLEEQIKKMERKEKDNNSSLLVAAVTIHNVPEGMAVGVIFAEAIQTGSGMLGAAMVFAVGVALQNLPEGAILSLPAAALGLPKKKAFQIGAMSGLVEPISAAAALLFTSIVKGTLPFTLSFAAGAMLYVVAEELIPLFGGKSRWGVFFFALGFSLMMFLDVSLG